MTLSRKHYEMIAKSIGWTIEDGARRHNFNTDIMYYYAGVISEMLQAENPKFDKGRFLDAVNFHAESK